MSHQRIWLSAACTLFLVGCGKPANSNTLKAPVLSLNDTNNGLIWEPVDGAVSYEITVDEETTSVEFPGYLFASEYGDYEVSIVSVDRDGNKSKPAEYSYETRVTRLGNLQFDGEKITWPGSDYYALEVSADGKTYTTVEENYYTVEESGIYYFRALKGFREAGHVYFSQTVTKCLVATKDVANPYILEDGNEIDNATLNEYYRKVKYVSGWEVAASYLTLDTTNEDYVNGTAVALHTWCHGYYYMFEKQIALAGSFNEMDFTIKTSTTASVILAFQITHTLVMNGIDLNGVYLKYTLNPAPTSWYQYRVTMDDPNWKINYSGTDYSFATVANMINGAGIKVNKLSDMLPFFDVFQFRINAAYQNNGPSAITYVDDVKLLNSDLQDTVIREIIPGLSVQKNYAFQGTNIKGGLTFNTNGHANMRITSPESVNLDVTYSIEDEVLTLVSAAQGKDFNAKFTSEDGGLTLTLASATGSYAQQLAGMKAEAITTLEDYESFTETGVGYDQHHAEEERTGLRAAYLCDQYTGSGSSPIGGSGWQLIDDEKYEDYLELSTTEAHTGTKSMDLISNAMTNRFMQWQLHDGSSKGWRGKTFSFWAKGGSKGTVTLRIGLYFAQPVGPSNHASDAARKLVDFPIEINSDWKEYTIELDSKKVYFGFSLLTLSNKSFEGSQRLYVDDFYVYNDLSPWAA